MLTEMPSNVSIAPQDYQFGGSVRLRRTYTVTKSGLSIW